MPLTRSRRRKVSRLREKPSLFDELVVQMMIVEAGVARACQSEDADARALPGRAAVAGAAAADVSQSRCAALPIARFEPFDMPRR